MYPMLKVQEYLLKFEDKDEALEALKNEFAIKVITNTEDDLVILNYDMIDSPKTDPIVRECRGLVLDKNAVWYKDVGVKANGWKLVARSFYRFFNHCEGEHSEFDWSNVEAQHKEDGSLIMVYTHNGKLRINTKGSFGYGEINDSGYTWNSLVTECLSKVKYIPPLPTATYVFELCSIYNKVVRHYSTPKLYLLAAFDTYCNEIDIDDSLIAGYFNVFERPESFIIHSIDEAIEYIKAKEREDATFEGLVLKDKNGNRMKVKSASYLMLHRSANNGNITWESIYDSCLTDDGGEEFTNFFPEYKDRFDKMKDFIKQSKEDIVETYNKYKDIEVQKDFALAIKGYRFAPILFALRKGEGTVDELFLSRSSAILKIFSLT